MARITSFLWINDHVAAARDFYVSVFRNSRVGATVCVGESGPGPRGAVMTTAFEFDGQEFVALTGGPQFTCSPAASFVASGDTQAEVDEYWQRLSADGEPQACGWNMNR